jgi:hypothetical protein
MDNVLNSYIPKLLVDLDRTNEDVVTVSTNYFSQQGDVYTLDKRTISPVVLQTTQSVNELRPEISNFYPFSAVTPLEFDGSTLILSPSITTQPTASQMYYVPIYFERYDPNVLSQIDKSFMELTNVVLEESANLDTEDTIQTTPLPEDLNLTIQQLEELLTQLRTLR